MKTERINHINNISSKQANMYKNATMSAVSVGLMSFIIKNDNMMENLLAGVLCGNYLRCYYNSKRSLDCNDS